MGAMHGLVLPVAVGVHSILPASWLSYSLNEYLTGTALGSSGFSDVLSDPLNPTAAIRDVTRKSQSLSTRLEAVEMPLETD